MQDITCSLKTSECVLEVWDATCRIPVTFGEETLFLPVIVNENIYSLAIKIKDIFKYIYTYHFICYLQLDLHAY